MTSGDGVVRRCHPIYATFVGDYPEQLLVTAIKNGWCPTCPAEPDVLGDLDSIGEPHDLAKILEAFNSISQGPTIFAQACRDAGVKPVQHPFWENLPFVNIYQSFAPDILHQLYQGVIKHLIGWLRTICGDNEIDARCRRLPPNHNIWIFMKGISHLSRVTSVNWLRNFHGFLNSGNQQKPAKNRIFGNLETYVPFHRNLTTRSWMET
jgi:Plavaka transposase